MEEKPIEDLPSEVSAARAAVTQHEMSPNARIVVPSERPPTFHPVANQTRKALNMAKADDEGFIRCSGAGVVEARIGRPLVDRAILLVDTLFKALKVRDIELTETEAGVAINVEGEPFRLRVHETRDRRPHVPTAKELKEQADRDAWRAKYPSAYSDRQAKVYRTWDWFPLGRLSFGLFAIDWREDYRECCAGHWYDRAAGRAEDHLNAAVIALVSTAVLIRHKRAVAAEQARIKAEEAERCRREAARRERATKRREYLFKKADAYSKFCSMATFAKMIEQRVVARGTEPFDRLACELNALVDNLGRQFGREENQRRDRQAQSLR